MRFHVVARKYNGAKWGNPSKRRAINSALSAVIVYSTISGLLFLIRFFCDPFPSSTQLLCMMREIKTSNFRYNVLVSHCACFVSVGEWKNRLFFLLSLSPRGNPSLVIWWCACRVFVDAMRWKSGKICRSLSSECDACRMEIVFQLIVIDTLRHFTAVDDDTWRFV